MKNNHHNKIDTFDYTVEILDKTHMEYISKFTSGAHYPEKGLGDYIKQEAFEDIESGDGVSYVVLQLDADKKVIDVISFFTLVSSAMPVVYRSDDENGVYETVYGIPATRLHMFAVDDKYQDVFYRSKPIAAWIFLYIINLIDEKSKSSFGIKALYLHALPSSKAFYRNNNMLEAEEYMKPFSNLDDDCDVMYVFIRDVNHVYEKNMKQISRIDRIKRKIVKYLLK